MMAHACILERELAALRLNLSVTMEELGEMRDRAEKAEAKIDALMFEYCPEEIIEVALKKTFGNEK
jgi:hypothetical protein